MISVCLVLTTGEGRATGEGDSTGAAKTNLEVMQAILGRIAREIIGASPVRRGDTVDLRMKPADESWIAQHAVTSEFRAFGCPVFIPNDSVRHTGFEIRIYTSEMHVRYDNMHRDGFLGTRKVRRTVSATMTCDVIAPGSGELVYSASPSLSSADTVAEGDIGNLELPSAKATRAELPSESFLDRVLEPVVIIGATGISIYLLFHVRS
jgi:hypothetical protein